MAPPAQAQLKQTHGTQEDGWPHLPCPAARQPPGPLSRQTCRAALPWHGAGCGTAYERAALQMRSKELANRAFNCRTAFPNPPAPEQRVGMPPLGTQRSFQLARPSAGRTACPMAVGCPQAAAAQGGAQRCAQLAISRLHSVQALGARAHDLLLALSSLAACCRCCRSCSRTTSAGPAAAVPQRKACDGESCTECCGG